MKSLSYLLIVITTFACTKDRTPNENVLWNKLAEEVRSETLRSWKAYKEYAWGHDVLLPISKGYKDWYEESLHISPIDAYGTIKLMGFNDEAKRIENYVADSISFDKDIFVKVFEVNIRILGGLLSMYHNTQNEDILLLAKDFGERLLPAFSSNTGIPYYWVNIKTGEVKGNVVNVAEAGSYLLEMGLLSYFTKEPIYYQAAKKASMAVFNRRSSIGLIGEIINVDTGEWVNSKNTHIGAGVDSYYEYLYKALETFGDEDLQRIWDKSIEAINKYIPEEFEGRLWYGQVNMETGDKTFPRVTLYDAFFPAILALSGDIGRAEKLQQTWNWLWNQYGLEPMIYNYKEKKPTWPVYDLNPEIIESVYYLWSITGKEDYRMMAKQYWDDIKNYCRNDIAFTQVTDVTTMEKGDYLATFFFAETLKYLYLVFSEKDIFDFDNHIFTTEAHAFKLSQFSKAEAKKRLGF